MKKIGKIIISVISFVAIISIVNPTNVIITESKKVNAGSDKNSVSTRELAMLASLVYEDVPNDSRYVGNTAGLGCNVNTETGVVSGKNGNTCKYIALEDRSASDLTLKDSKYNIWQYIEGLSERKMHSLVSFFTSAFKEDGQKYYFLNFADTTEMDGWEIVHYQSKETSKLAGAPIDFDWDGEFYAVTFKKGDNYVIAYRGTDYPDLFEWLQDVGYAIKGGEMSQANLAYEYAQAEYKRIVSENSNAKIYVTGHSLGAYLAQVGGAAIIDSVSGKTDPYRTPDEIKTLEDYKNIYNPASNLKQVAYFNGMGVNGAVHTNNFAKNIDNALVYLSTHTASGKVANTGRYVNYSKEIQSSGRLVLYSMDADPISDIGLHYGEIYKLDVGADAISNHHNTHANPVGEFLQGFATSGENAIDYINKSLAELEKKAKNKFVSSVSENLYSIINVEEKLDEAVNILPKFVEDAISKENGNKMVSNYGLGSILNNLTTNVSNFSNKYKGVEISNIFDHFNMNHETDSFACLIDSENGKISNDKINIVVSVNNTPLNGTYYTNKYEMPEGYTYGNEVTSNENNIVLTAAVNEGCAKSYDWYYSTDNSNFTHLGQTVRNKIIVSKDLIGENKKTTLYFKVKISYGDNYQETKVSLGDGLAFEYKKSGNSSETNPTMNDGITKTKGSLTSDAVAVTVVHDNKAPVCNFLTDTITVTLERTGFLNLSVEPKNINVELRCSDNFTGIDASVDEINSFSNFKLVKNPGIGTDIVEYTQGKKITSNINSDKTSVILNVPVRILRKPSIYTPSLTYKGTFTDKVGNKSREVTVKFNIEKAAR